MAKNRDVACLDAKALFARIKTEKWWCVECTDTFFISFQHVLSFSQPALRGSTAWELN